LLTICFAPSLSDSFIFLTLTRLVVVLKFINFRFALFTPPSRRLSKVSRIRGVRRFRVRGKLAPRYIGPYQILARRGEVAYQLSLLDNLSVVHDVFHVSQLKKCLRVPKEQLPVGVLKSKKA
jgi:hypothetical protein